MSRIKHEGLFPHRLSSNPTERRLANRWQRMHELYPGTLRTLLDPEGRGKAITQRDATVAATVIQWLGSPVGQEFLRGVQD